MIDWWSMNFKFECSSKMVRLKFRKCFEPLFTVTTTIVCDGTAIVLRMDKSNTELRDRTWRGVLCQKQEPFKRRRTWEKTSDRNSSSWWCAVSFWCNFNILRNVLSWKYVVRWALCYPKRRVVCCSFSFLVFPVLSYFTPSHSTLAFFCGGCCGRSSSRFAELAPCWLCLEKNSRK